MSDLDNEFLCDMLKSDFTGTGTCFVLENLRDQWNEAVIERVKSSLQKLLPPMEIMFLNYSFFTRYKDKRCQNFTGFTK